MLQEISVGEFICGWGLNKKDFYGLFTIDVYFMNCLHPNDDILLLLNWIESNGNIFSEEIMERKRKEKLLIYSFDI